MSPTVDLTSTLEEDISVDCSWRQGKHSPEAQTLASRWTMCSVQTTFGFCTSQVYLFHLFTWYY